MGVVRTNMVLDPFRASDAQIDSVWESMEWGVPTGFCQIYRLPSEWEPYEEIRLPTGEYHVYLSTEDWTVANSVASSRPEEFHIEPPTLGLFVRGQGESPAKVIASAREKAEILTGLITLLLGSGYPVLSKAYEAPFRKDKAETIKYSPALTRVHMKVLLQSDLYDALKPVSEGVSGSYPEHLKLALRWYGKGISEEHPVDKFIALYQCCLATVTRWYYVEHPQEYEGRDAPPRKIFGDWVRNVMKPGDADEEESYFQPFNGIVGTRNRIFKANELVADPHAIENAVICARRVLNWSVSG